MPLELSSSEEFFFPPLVTGESRLAGPPARLGGLLAPSPGVGRFSVDVVLAGLARGLSPAVVPIDGCSESGEAPGKRESPGNGTKGKRRENGISNTFRTS